MSYVEPAEGPQGTRFLAHIEGVAQYVGKDLTVQIDGKRLDDFGPVRVQGDVVELHPKIPYGSIFTPGIYDVRYLIYDPWPTKFVTSKTFATFEITPTPTPGILAGIVVDAETKAPILPWVQITVWKEGKWWQSALTDEQGHYVVRDLEPGEYDVQASHWEYQSQTRTIIIESGKTTTCNFELVKGILPPGPEAFSWALLAACAPLFVVGTVIMGNEATAQR